MGLDYGRKNLAFTTMKDAQDFIETYGYLFVVPKRKNKKAIEEGGAIVIQTGNKEYPYKIGFLMNHDVWRKMCDSELITRKKLYCGYIGWANYSISKNLLCFEDGGDVKTLFAQKGESK